MFVSHELPGAPHSWRYRLQLALLVAGPGAAVSHEAAAALASVPALPEGPIAILALHSCKNHRLPAVRFRETRALPAPPITVIDGLAGATIAAPRFDLAGAI